ncbi:DgyrCDS11831 [Dimorphilus gyrociliatus]|uniref:DgyrCDS11831 n=1 Tax=Dimorphilus gyrociliatus TaxID=2664684 RepID=A0A7I8W4M4_9ANNE|nr:DgyrCDS11831 [Dimorphilus gyrociliatus]
MNNVDGTDLPIEDAIWNVQLVDYVDENDLTLKSAEVIDIRSNSLLGGSTLPYEKRLDEEIKDIIKETALKPIVGPPRLPTSILCNDCDL